MIQQKKRICASKQHRDLFASPKSIPETHPKRKATQHGCLHSFLGDGDTGIEKVYDEEEIFCTGPTRAAKAEQKSLVLAR
jgi:hypothetical protein